MMVLTRKLGESIVIGDGSDKVVLTLVDVKDRSRAILGIDAPPSVRIDRAEKRVGFELKGSK